MENKTNPLRAPNNGAKGVLNIAHRGARAFAPENTLASFGKAKKFACPMFETDVHMSKDGELIIHHDDQLGRCTDVKKKFPDRNTYFVSDFTFAELQTLDAGSWYIDELNMAPGQRQDFLKDLGKQEIAQYVSADDMKFYASGEVKLPTLEQALELAKSNNMMINIEIKTMPRMYPGITDAVIQLVNKMAMENHTLISSFDHEQLLIARQLNEAIATAVLTSDRLANPGDYLNLLKADAYNPGCYDDYDSLGFGSVSGKLDPRGIKQLRERELGVNVWTCNNKDHMRELIAANVTGLITDYPNRVQEVLSAS